MSSSDISTGSVCEATWQQLVGVSQSSLQTVADDQPFLLHGEVLPHWRTLVAQADAAGFRLSIASAWRGFERQRLIWNGKATGERDVLDACGNRLDTRAMTQPQLLFAILRWSAIPGCSRHHWGTDLDVYDAAAVAADYRVQLTTAECCDGGPFARLHEWLDTVLQQPQAAFFRPYAHDSNGIAPERWHLSCLPVAERYESLLDESRLLDWVLSQDIALKDCIRTYWHDIFHRYVLVQHAGD